LSQTSGQLTTSGFLDFLNSLTEGPIGAVTGLELEGLRSLLEQVKLDQGLSRAPVFNEILIKLQVLGDSEIDDDFLRMSPALQALRGGVSSALENFLGGQADGGQDRGRENQERYRQFLQAMATGQEGPSGAATTAINSGYGGQSEPLARQIAQKIMFSRRRGIHRLKMNLNPADLGRLDIELAVKGGVLTARIKAENRAAYEAWGRHMPELKKALAEGGVELTELTLAHDDAESGQTLTAGLAELTNEARTARVRAVERPGEVSRVI
jgi:hypothetical protein